MTNISLTRKMQDDRPINPRISGEYEEHPNQGLLPKGKW
ncbi:hypothetical protein MalM14_59380 [Gimesia chilikensis]|nr:hypothetical protein MalM14_59380 [Gimesia chilikensis]